jgi:UDP-glucose-4-epimerase GalE
VNIRERVTIRFRLCEISREKYKSLRRVDDRESGDNMAILVVGGAGYIGSHTTRALRSRGDEVIIFDNLSTGHSFLADGSELIVGDISDKDKLTDALIRSTAVMHFVAHAYVGESVENPRKCFRNNVEAALTLLNATVDAGVRTFVFSSSCAVYGAPSKVPIEESELCKPINPYGVSKLFFENALEAYGRAYGLRSVVLRYFNAAGADESCEIGELHDPETHLIPLALAAAEGIGPELQVFGTDYSTPDGICIRDYVHVTDLAEAHVLALENLTEGGEPAVLNLGAGEGYSIKQILDTVRAVTGKDVPWRAAPRRPGDPPVLIADPSRAGKLLDWQASYRLDGIIATAWKWMQHGRALENSPLGVSHSSD